VPDRPDSESSPAGTPRWVKVFGVIAAVLVVVFIVLLLFGGGHGPGRHGGGLDTGSESPASHTGPPPGFEHGESQP
jgi:hypothetical protein